MLEDEEEKFIPESNILYVDNRESMILAKLIPFLTNREIKIRVIHITEKLKISGDYYYKCDHGELLIERKQMSDLDGSIKKENVFSQSQKMALWVQAKSKRYASIKTIGDNCQENKKANINYANRIGACEAIQSGTGIPVNNYSCDDGFIWSIYKNIRSLEEGKFGIFRTIDLFKYKFPDIDLKNNNLKSIYTDILRRLGATKKQAEKIVDTYHIMAWNDLGILEERSNLTDIPRLGPKTADKIHKRMGIIKEMI